jgi:hypothetical protein
LCSSSPARVYHTSPAANTSYSERQAASQVDPFASYNTGASIADRYTYPYAITDRYTHAVADCYAYADNTYPHLAANPIKDRQCNRTGSNTGNAGNRNSQDFEWGYT